jgi:hypothetical protein
MWQQCSAVRAIMVRSDGAPLRTDIAKLRILPKGKTPPKRGLPVAALKRPGYRATTSVVPD